MLEAKKLGAIPLPEIGVVGGAGAPNLGVFRAQSKQLLMLALL